MVENRAYCPDILVQSAAANAALNAFNKGCWQVICARAWQTISVRGRRGDRQAGRDAAKADEIGKSRACYRQARQVEEVERMKQYNVTGMSCAACSARRWKRRSTKVPGVTSCSVESADEFHGRGRNGKRAGDHPRRRAGGLRRKPKKGAGNQVQASMQEAEKQLVDHGDAEAQEKAVLVSGLLAGP